jgi:hypothetical protein
LEELELI